MRTIAEEGNTPVRLVRLSKKKNGLWVAGLRHGTLVDESSAVLGRSCTLGLAFAKL
jgi:hypothetical protein